MTYTILVADDENQQIRRISEMLIKNGYIVLSASSGKEVLQEVAQHSPDMLILDYCMADMFAPEVIRHLRKLPQSHDLPVILITCRVADADLAESMEAYAEEYVVAKMLKVISLYELLSEVQKALENKIKPQSSD